METLLEEEKSPGGLPVNDDVEIVEPWELCKGGSCWLAGRELTQLPVTGVAERSLCDNEDAGYVVACEDVPASCVEAEVDCEREEVRGSMVSSEGRKTSAIKTIRAVNLSFCRETRQCTWLALRLLTVPAPSLLTDQDDSGRVRKKKRSSGEKD